jgi:uncharacterized hydrophobic protein (TIGR00271 family)
MSDEPDLDVRVGPDDATGGEDRDLPGDDVLLGVPAWSFLHLRALGGLGLLAIAVTVVVWPEPTDKVLGIMAGLVIAGYVAVTLPELVRDRDARTFTSIVSVSVATGFSFALVLHPDESLRSVTQVSGVILLGLAVLTAVQLALRRHPVGWGVAKILGLSAAGALLLAFPSTLVVVATSVVAAVLAAAGLVQVFAPTPTDGEDDRYAGPWGLLAWIRERPVLAEDRQLLQAKVFFEGEDSAVRYARFAALMTFAAVIASIGVVVESTAVVIGAMLIAPLMVPLLGTALALTMGWPLRARRSASIALSGIGLAIGVGAIVGAVAPRAVDVTTNSEVLSRITPTTLDLAIAIAAGAAGAYALSRRDVSDSLPGVAVAIALVPPLTVVGLCWQQGEWAAGNGALLLFLTNATAILLAGGTTFILIGVAPLHRVSESQQRLKSVIVTLLAAAAVVVVLLALNGLALTQAEIARAEIEDVMSEWTAEHEEFRVLDIRTTGSGTIVVDLAGPARPPELAQLLDELRDTDRGETEVRVTWVEQEQVTIRGG